MNYELVSIKTILSIVDIVLGLLFLVTFIFVPVLALRECKRPLEDNTWHFLRAYFMLGLGFSVLYFFAEIRAGLGLIVFSICLVRRFPKKHKLAGITFVAYGYLVYSILSGLGEEHIMPHFPIDERSYTHILLPDKLKAAYTEDFMKKTKLHEKLRSQKPTIVQFPPFPVSVSYRIIDSWGKAVSYRPSPDQRSYNLISSGKDGTEGTDDDIVLHFN